jgi:hypothetical protein
VPDEAFEDLWRHKGGPELVAFHAVFAGAALSSDEIRSMLSLTMEQLRAACGAAERVGIVESGESRVSFLAFPSDSSQRGRLDWCLEEHKAEFDKLVGQVRSRLLLRYLGTPPGEPAA